MKKNLKLSVAVIIALLFSALLLKADGNGNSSSISILPPNVERWQLISGLEEKIIFNDQYKSGLVCRFYIDPEIKYGLGATISVFYKDGSEYLFWKGWMLNTESAQSASPLNSGVWYTMSPSKTPAPFGCLQTILQMFEILEPQNFIDGKPLLEKMEFYAADDPENVQWDKKTIFYFNKNSANDPNPTP